MLSEMVMTENIHAISSGEGINSSTMLSKRSESGFDRTHLDHSFFMLNTELDK